MATATHTGPIGIEQINTTLYVSGPSGSNFQTLQAAVDFARIQGGYWSVVIEHGATVPDAIGSITGGTASIYIFDSRFPTQQLWTWNGTKFVTEDFNQANGFIAQGVPLAPPPACTILEYDPQGTNGIGTGNFVTVANQGKGMPSLQLKGTPGDGGQQWTFLRCDLDPTGTFKRIQMPERIEVYNDPATYALWLGQNPDINISKGMYVWPKPSANGIDFQGMTEPGNFDQTIRLNHLGGNVEIGMAGLTTLGPTNLTGDVNVSGNLTVDGPIGGKDVDLFGRLTVWSSPDQTAYSFFDCISSPEVAGRIMNFNNASTTIAGGFQLRGFSSDLSRQVNYLSCVDDGINAHTDVLTDFVMKQDADVVGTLTANDAAFMTCLVDDSPVRTFANSPDTGTPGGMEWPPAGIGVSTGTAWGTSIAPATVPRTNTVNTFTADQTITGKVSSSFYLVTGSFTGPWNNGIALIDMETGNDARLMAKSNNTNIGGIQFAGASDDADGRFFVYANFAEPTGSGSARAHFFSPIEVDGTVTAGNGIFSGAVNMAHLNVLSGAGDKASIGVGGSTVYLESFGADTATMGKFTFRSEHSDGSNYADIVTIDGAGNATFNGDTTIQGKAIIGGNAIRIGNRSTPSEWLTGSPSISCDPQNVIVNASGGGSILFNWDKGTGGVAFGNGTQTNTQVASIDAGGNATFTGHVTTGFVRADAFSFGSSQSPTYGGLSWDGGGTTFLDGYPNGRIWINSHAPSQTGDVTCYGNFSVTNGTKTFRIPHPLDETKDLYHACLEGPENGVYYRGEAQVVDGYAVVTLPDYFEALTYPEDRSVQLTQIYEGTPLFARFAASRIVDGQFTIHATDDVTVAWEVKAVRRIGVDRLKVVQDKPEPQPAQ